jgi:YtcA family
MLCNQIRSAAKPGFFLVSTFLLVGCSRAPSVDVMGSFFPGWLVCLVSGIALTAAARLALMRFQIKVAIPILFSPSLTAVFTFMLWLLLFS